MSQNASLQEGLDTNRHSCKATTQGPHFWRLVRDMDQLMSEESLIFDSLPEEFECQISHSVMTHPVLSIPCGHLFDRASLTSFIRCHDPGSDVKCPVCSKALTSQKFMPMPEFQKVIYATVAATCPFEGCQKQMLLSNLEPHMRDTCPHARMVCNAVDLLGVQCGADVKRSEIHAHEKVCPNRLVHCRHSGCGQMFPFADQANQENVCGFRPITCACGMAMMTRDYESHSLNQCPFTRKVTCCGFCEELLPRHLLQAHMEDPANHQRHMACMTKRLQEYMEMNMRLNKQVHQLRHENHCLRIGSRPEKRIPFKTAANKEVIKPRGRSWIGPDGKECTRFVLVGLDKPDLSLAPKTPKASAPAPKTPKASAPTPKTPKSSAPSPKIPKGSQKSESDRGRQSKRSRSHSAPDVAVRQKKRHFDVEPSPQLSKQATPGNKDEASPLRLIPSERRLAEEEPAADTFQSRPPKRRLTDMESESAESKKQCCRGA